MSALGEAIARRQPAVSLRATSPLHGLRRGSLGTVDLVAQSVAAAAPAGVLLTQAGLAEGLGTWAYATLVVAAGVVMLVAGSASVFARRIAAAGGVYTFVTRGLGPILGFVAGAAIAAGYAGMSIDTLHSGARRIARLLQPGDPASAAPPGSGPSTDPGMVALVTVVAVAVIVLVIVVGARATTRVLLVIEIAAVSGILALSLVVFATTGWNLGQLVPDLDDVPSVGAFAAGLGLALMSFVGFESGAALGPEARRPLASVPRALVWTGAALALVYLFGAAAEVSASASGATGRTSGLQGSAVALAPWLGTVVEVVVAASWIACTLACTNALVRLVLTMAREGVLPAWLGRTSHRFGTPHVAAVAVGVLIGAGTLIESATGRGAMFDATAALASGLGFVIAYLLLSAAAVAYLMGIGEFTLREAWPAMLGVGILGAIALAETLTLSGVDLAALGVLIVVVGAATAIHVVRLRRGAVVAASTGVYDTPVARDALATSGERQGRS
ncbi:APC family permease [Agromyces sp. LHK192]|uniref:APC family permease n=1 Tax=Agromyces sp. LHK192 TaxID=2498704 RepID=UPI000FDA3CC3|nr:APC family permease [Agromyces sp. LHK192]